jgi:hypothetical protein
MLLTVYRSQIDIHICFKTRLTGESQFHISIPLGIKPGSLITGSKKVDHWTSGTVYECSEIAGSPQIPPTSWLCQLWSWKEDLQPAWNWDRRAVWDQVGLSHCWHNGLLTVRDEASLRRGHNDQSCRGHQCSETTLTGESQFHIRPPGDWTRVPHDGKQTGRPLDQWNCVWMQWDCRLSTSIYICVCKYMLPLQYNQRWADCYFGPLIYCQLPSGLPK